MLLSIEPRPEYMRYERVTCLMQVRTSCNPVYFNRHPIICTQHFPTVMAHVDAASIICYFASLVTLSTRSLTFLTLGLVEKR
jgi:hypothetical protein